MKHPECRYCDGGFYPTRIEDGTAICRNCGAEWNPVMVEDDDDDENGGDEA